MTADQARQQAGPGVRFEAVDGIGRITLARPEVSNAVDLATAREFASAVDAAAGDDVRAIVLAAAGPRFCAGGDVRAFLGADDKGRYLRELATTLEAGLRRLAELAKPVIAGVEGAVAGAGLAFVLNSDVVFAARSTKFTLAYAGIGLTPDCGVSYLLPRAIGTSRALELALTGRKLSAEEALSWGLVTRVVDDGTAAGAAAELATRLASGPAHALGQAKRLIRSSAATSRGRSAADEAATIAAAVDRPEAQHLIERFLGA